MVTIAYADMTCQTEDAVVKFFEILLQVCAEKGLHNVQFAGFTA